MNLVGKQAFDQVHSLCYTQTKSSYENFLRKHNLELASALRADGYQVPDLEFQKGRYWLESCGTHTSVNLDLITGALDDPGRGDPKLPGSWRERLPDRSMAFFADPGNWPELDAVRDVDDDLMANEVPQFYPLMMRRVFGTEGIFLGGMTYQDFRESIDQGHGIQITTIDPGHYIGIYDFDRSTGDLFAVDPWPDHIADGKWWMRRISRTEVDRNVTKWGVVHTGKRLSA